MFVEGSATRRGSQPRYIEDGSTVRAYCSDHECQPCCKNEVMGVTYMNTMTTLVGRVTLSGPGQEVLTQEPTIQDITDLV